MTQFAFGTGTLILRRTDVANTMPALIGTLQDVSIDFDRKLDELLGQYAVAVALGGGQLSIKGKAKFARIQATHINNLLLNQTLTASAALQLATGENVTVATGAATVANGATFVQDEGVFSSLTGVQLQPVVSGPVAGVSYVPGGGGVGTYTFNATDNGIVYTIYYSYTTATGNKIVAANALMGAVPTFELHFKESFTYLGAVKDIIVKLNACSAAKLTLPFANTKFMIPEFDFVAQADAANNWGTISLTE
jgi:hypothetical protein